MSEQGGDWPAPHREGDRALVAFGSATGALFISRSTVKTHLSHVYAKLDVSNRTELARLASRHLDDG